MESLSLIGTGPDLTLDVARLKTPATKQLIVAYIFKYINMYIHIYIHIYNLYICVYRLYIQVTTSLYIHIHAYNKPTLTDHFPQIDHSTISIALFGSQTIAHAVAL